MNPKTQSKAQPARSAAKTGKSAAPPKKRTAAQDERANIAEWLQNVFSSEDRQMPQREALTGDLLYDAASFLCLRRKVKICTFERLRRACPDARDFRDIARLSGFPCREVKLPEHWPSADIEPVLTYLHIPDSPEGEKRIPVVCFAGRLGRAYLYDPRSGRVRRMTKKDIRSVEKTAWVLCRPFPTQTMDLRELVRFSLDEISAADVLLVMVAMWLVTQVGLVISVLNKAIYDHLIPMGNKTALYELGGLFLAVMAANVLFSILQKLAQFRLTGRMGYSLQSAIYDRLFHVSESYVSGKECGVLAYQASSLSSTYISVFQGGMTILMQGIFSLFYLRKMFQLSPQLFGMGFGIVAAESAALVVLSLVMRRSSAVRAKQTGKIQSFLYQVFSGITTVRTGGAEDEVVRRYMTMETELYRNDRKTAMTRHFSSQTLAIGNAAAMLAFYHYIGGSAAGMSIGTFMSFLSAFGFFAAALVQVVVAGTEMYASMPMLRYSSDILRQKPERSVGGTILHDMKGDIVVSGISFHYEGQEKAALNNVSLHVKPGEYLGIVGESGSGKSTLLRLLLGFEKPDSGEIFYDGVSLKKLNLPELRRSIGTVLQDGCIFSGSIYKNISISAPAITPEQVQEVVKTVCLAEEIEEMPMGLNTLISEETQTISGGQKQRILLARAIANKPRILFLDEATSSLDNLVQEEIADNLSRLASTRVVIAHRLSTVRSCDRIAVLHDGEIAEIGSYEELMQKQGLFFRMASRQMAQSEQKQTERTEPINEMVKIQHPVRVKKKRVAVVQHSLPVPPDRRAGSAPCHPGHHG